MCGRAPGRSASPALAVGEAAVIAAAAGGGSASLLPGQSRGLFRDQKRGRGSSSAFSSAERGGLVGRKILGLA